MIRNQPLYHMFMPDHDESDITREEVAPAFQAANALPIPWADSVDISNAVVFQMSSSNNL
jgi:hypothetical protein